jgi:hypothetical protein
MYIIRDPCDVSGLSHSGIRHIVAQRITQLRLSADETLSDLGEFFVIEPGDSIPSLEETTGCYIATDFTGEDHYGSPDFEPNHESLEHHREQQCFEMVFIMTDDGYFTVLLIPDDPGIDPDLLSLCRDYS